MTDLQRLHSLCCGAIKNIAADEYAKSRNPKLHWMERRDAYLRAEGLEAAIRALNDVWLAEEARRG